jgi:DHA1 family tetracycline resistance protein-like MFS transporter
VSPLVIIFLTVFIDLVGFGIIIPMLPFYAEAYGASALQVGLLATSFSLMQFLFAPVWGRLSDRVGRRPVILLGLVGSAVSYFAFGMADTLATLFAARILAGIAGANIPTAQAFIADTTTAENRAKGMGLIGAALGLGFILGPAIGGFLSQWGYHAPAFFAAALSFANFVAGYFFLPESLPADRRGTRRAKGRIAAFQQAMARPALPLVLLVSFLVMTAFSAFESMFALFAGARFGYGATTIGYLFAWVGVVLAVVQGLLVGRVVRRVGEHRLVPAAILVMASALAAHAFAPNVPSLMAAMGLLAAGMGFNSPSILSMVSRLADPTDQGTTLGVSQSLASLARIVGPVWGGFVFDRFGITVPFLTSAALMLVACGLSVAAVRGFRAEQSAALH